MSDPRRLKRSLLRANRTLNPRPEDVKHSAFQDSEFFDADDLLQVKYEILRLHETLNDPITPSGKGLGMSRPSFYQAQVACQEAGLAGLLPHKRGPRSGHKLTPELMTFVEQLQAA